MAEVAADSLKKVGFNVDLQFSDWGTVTTRQQNRGAPEQGGWNLFVTYASGATMQSPMTNIGTNMACEKAWAGWPCDAEAERLRGAVVDAPDDASRKLAQSKSCTAGWPRCSPIGCSASSTSPMQDEPMSRAC
jgi:peptide/nickel transport system substrate-binding protein